MKHFEENTFAEVNYSYFILFKICNNLFSKKFRYTLYYLINSFKTNDNIYLKISWCYKSRHSLVIHDNY